MAAIFADRSAELQLPWLDPLQYQHVTEEEKQEDVADEFVGALPAVAFPAGSRGEGLGPKEEDRHMRKASLAKWHGILRRMGVYSSLARTVEAEEGDTVQVLDDVLANRAEATLRSRAWPILQYERWCGEQKLPPYPFTESRPTST